MSKYSIFGEICSMIFRRLMKALMQLKWSKRYLLLKVLACLFPSLFSLIGFIDNIFSYRHFFIIEEGFQLFIDERDVVSWELPCHIDILEHITFVVHFFDWVIKRIIRIQTSIRIDME